MSTPEEQRRYQREWIRRRRAEFFAGKSCRFCGSTESLELDHIDASTKVSHSIWSWRESRRLAEIAKCQILCHDCHVQKTTEKLEKARGVGKPNAKLNDDKIREIRSLIEQGRHPSVVAERFGVSERNIRYIRDGKAWCHVTSTTSILN